MQGGKAECVRILDRTVPERAFGGEQVQRVRRGPRRAVGSDRLDHDPQLRIGGFVTVQHAEGLTIVHADTDAQRGPPVFVDHASNLETGDFRRHDSVLDHDVGTGAAKHVGEGEVARVRLERHEVRRRCRDGIGVEHRGRHGEIRQHACGHPRLS